MNWVQNGAQSKILTPLKRAETSMEHQEGNANHRVFHDQKLLTLLKNGIFD